MGDIQNIVQILIQMTTYLMGVGLFAIITYTILKEFGVDIIRGKLNWKDYMNIVVGSVILLFMLMYGYVLIAYALTQGWSKAKPYVVEFQTSITSDVMSIVSGDGILTIVPQIVPQAPTAVYNQGGGVLGQDDNVGGGGGGTIAPVPVIIPSVTPAQKATVVPHESNVTVVPYVEPEPTAGWYLP